MVRSSCVRLASWPTVLAAMVVGLASGVRPASASLMLVNGNFSDVSGLAPTSPNWYSGLPAGWSTANSSSSSTPGYSVYVDGSAPYVGNLSQLGSLANGFNPLYQTIGSLDATGKVTVSFETRNDWTPAFAISVGVGIYPASDIGTWGSPLAFNTFNTTGSQTLEANNVSAGLPLAVAFWTAGGTPGLDNVIVVPEPSGAIFVLISVVGAGGFAAFRRRASGRMARA